jgi:hypothetical protein
LLAVLMAAAGCGKSDPAPTAEEAPLTVEQWKELPVAEKYEPATFERLKAGDPKLADDRGWAKFTRETLLPAKKKDQPANP